MRSRNPKPGIPPKVLPVLEGKRTVLYNSINNRLAEYTIRMVVKLTSLESGGSRLHAAPRAKLLLVVPVLVGLNATLVSILFIRSDVTQGGLGFPYPWLEISYVTVICPALLGFRCPPYILNLTVNWPLLSLDTLIYTAVALGLVLLSRGVHASIHRMTRYVTRRESQRSLGETI